MKRTSRGVRLTQAVLLVAMAACTTASRAEGPSGAKYALLIGNRSYPGKHVASAHDDVGRLGKVLRGLGFEVVEALDVSRQGLEDRLHQFEQKLSADSTALVYFSGHGVQWQGVNYLVPVDVHVGAPGDIPQQSVALGDVLRAVENGKTKLIFLDACRDPPFSSEVNAKLLKGLADNPMGPPDTLISFAASPGRVAQSRNGGLATYYTEALLRYLPVAGLRLTELLMRVRVAVETNTSGGQTPWENGSLRADVFFRPAASATFRITEADDDVLIVLNGRIVASARQGGDLATTVELPAGDSPLSVLVYNERGFSGGVEAFGGHQPLGWRYSLAVSSAGRDLKTLSGAEAAPAKDGPHHGKLFEVARGTLRVEEETGEVSFQSEEVRQ